MKDITILLLHLRLNKYLHSLKGSKKFYPHLRIATLAAFDSGYLGPD